MALLSKENTKYVKSATAIKSNCVHTYVSGCIAVQSIIPMYPRAAYLGFYISDS